MALNGQATSSTTYSSRQAKKAIDGNANTAWGSHMFSTVLGDPSPWWLLELQQTYSVQFVRIYNRMGCCPLRLDRLKITIGADGSTPKENPYCTAISQVGIAVKDYMCEVGILQGRYIYIYTEEAPDADLFITVAEVEVWVLP